MSTTTPTADGVISLHTAWGAMRDAYGTIVGELGALSATDSMARIEGGLNALYLLADPADENGLDPYTVDGTDLPAELTACLYLGRRCLTSETMMAQYRAGALARMERTDPVASRWLQRHWHLHFKPLWFEHLSPLGTR